MPDNVGLQIRRIVQSAIMTASLGAGLAFSQPAELPFREAQRNAVSQPVPEYPALGRQAQVSGLVVFRLSIDQQGHVASLELESGHPLLLAGTSETLRKWQYKPFQLPGGGARDVTVRVGLRFDASAGSVKVCEPPAIGEHLSAGKEAPLSGVSEPFSVNAAVLEAHNRQRKLPKYPEEAKSRKLEGTVRVRVTIAPNGNVTEAVAVSGPKALQPVATEAVRQWKYRPFLRAGTPVQVIGDAYVTFTLNPDAQLSVFPGDDIDALLDAALMTVRELKLEQTEKYCFTAMRHAREIGPDHIHTIREALEILYQLYSRTANANPEQREDVYKRWVSVATQNEKAS